MEDDYIKKALFQTVKQWLELRAKIDTLRKQESEIDREAFALLPKIHSLFELCGDLSPSSPLGKLMKTIKGGGLTVSVVNILRGTGEWMSPVQIRDQMIRFRIDLTKSKNPVSGIHTILGRLVDAGDVEQGKDPKSGKAVFRWKPPVLFELPENAEIPDAAIEILLNRPKKKRPRRKTKEVKGLLN